MRRTPVRLRAPIRAALPGHENPLPLDSGSLVPEGLSRGGASPGGYHASFESPVMCAREASSGHHPSSPYRKGDRGGLSTLDRNIRSLPMRAAVPGRPVTGRCIAGRTSRQFRVPGHVRPGSQFRTSSLFPLSKGGSRGIVDTRQEHSLAPDAGSWSRKACHGVVHRRADITPVSRPGHVRPGSQFRASSLFPLSERGIEGDCRDATAGSAHSRPGQPGNEKADDGRARCGRLRPGGSRGRGGPPRCCRRCGPRAPAAGPGL